MKIKNEKLLKDIELYNGIEDWEKRTYFLSYIPKKNILKDFKFFEDITTNYECRVIRKYYYIKDTILIHQKELYKRGGFDNAKNGESTTANVADEIKEFVYLSKDITHRKFMSKTDKKVKLNLYKFKRQQMREQKIKELLK